MTAAPLQADNREEHLLSSLRGVLESQNYPWERPVSFKLGAGSSPTHSLKELLISSSVDMEAATDTNITALCTMDIEPAECTSCFEKLLSFSEECDSTHKSDISHILYPIFVHVYLNLVAGDHSELAASFYDKFAGSVGRSHKSEMKELAEITSVRHLSSSALVTKFRSQKYSARMSNKSFQLMMQFLQVCQTPVLLSMIQRHLAIEVYSEASISNGDIKGDQKKPSHSPPTFIKPKITQLDDNRLQIKSKSKHQSSSQGFTVAMTDTHSGKGAKPMQRTSSASHVPARLAEFKEKLAQLSQLDPSTPSVALHTVTTQHNNAHCATFSAASRQYACGFADSSLHLWSLSPGATTSSSSSHMPESRLTESHTSHSASAHKVLLGHHGPVYGTCFSSNGQFLLSTSEDCTVRLWNIQRRSSVVSYRGHAYPVWDTAFSPVDVYFASASYDRTARLWATDLVYPLRIFTGHTAAVDVVRFHPNGRYIATGSSDQTCRLWDIQNGQCVRLMPGSKGPITSLAFSPNGKLLVSGGEGGMIHVWDLGSGAVLQECPGSSSSQQITSLAFSPDGTLLASSSYGNQIKLWNARTLSIAPQSQSTNSSDQDLVSQCYCPDNCQVLHLQFTHRNCLHAIATVASDASTQTNSIEPMDTSSSMMGFQGSSLPAFQQMPMLTSLHPGTLLPFD